MNRKTDTTQPGASASEGGSGDSRAYIPQEEMFERLAGKRNELFNEETGAELPTTPEEYDDIDGVKKSWEEVDDAGKSKQTEKSDPEAQATNLSEGVDKTENSGEDGGQLDDPDGAATPNSEGVDNDPPPETPPETPPASRGQLVTVTLDDGTTVQVPAQNVRATLKIDGEEFEKGFDEVSREYQKSGAADKRLQEAAQQKRDLDERQRAIEEKEKQPPSGAAPQQKALSSDVREEAERVAQVLFTGDEDSTVDAIAEILSAARGQAQPGQAPTPEISVDDLTVRVEAELDNRNASRAFAKEFPNIVKSKGLLAEADRFAEIVATEDSSLSRTEIFLEAGRRTQAWLRDLVGVQTESAPPGDPPADPPTNPPKQPVKASVRRVTKADVDSQPIPSSRVAGLGEGEEEEPSHSDTISQMMRDRGQL